MRHSLKTLALAAGIAVTASAGTAITPAAAASAAPLGIDMAVQKTGGPAGVQLARHTIPPVLTANRRCLLPKYKIHKTERTRLKIYGYKQIKYIGFSQYRRSCLQVIRFTACRGVRKYRFTIRYKNARLQHIGRKPIGLCLVLPRKLKSAS